MNYQRLPNYWRAMGMLVLLFIGLNVQDLQGQSGLTPLSQEQATNETNARYQAFGFYQVYFSNEDINGMLANEGATGVRFYTVRPGGLFGPGDPSVMAVAIQADGTEVGSYVRMDGMRSKYEDAQSARNFVERSYNSSVSTLAADISSEALYNSVMSSEATGMHVKPGNDGNSDSFIYVAANATAEASSDAGSGYFRDDQPCPPDCGTGLLMEFN